LKGSKAEAVRFWHSTLGIYPFRFDLNDDAREEVTFKIRFREVTHAVGDEHRHVQSFEVRQATGDLALRGEEGDLLVEGRTGQVAVTEPGIRTFAGLAPDLFAGDAAALGLFRNALYKEDKFAPEAFQNRQNFFAGRQDCRKGDKARGLFDQSGRICKTVHCAGLPDDPSLCAGFGGGLQGRRIQRTRPRR